MNFLTHRKCLRATSDLLIRWVKFAVVAASSTSRNISKWSRKGTRTRMCTCASPAIPPKLACSRRSKSGPVGPSPASIWYLETLRWNPSEWFQCSATALRSTRKNWLNWAKWRSCPKNLFPIWRLRRRKIQLRTPVRALPLSISSWTSPDTFCVSAIAFTFGRKMASSSSPRSTLCGSMRSKFTFHESSSSIFKRFSWIFVSGVWRFSTARGTSLRRRLLTPPIVCSTSRKCFWVPLKIPIRCWAS